MHKRKYEGVGDFDDAFSPITPASGFRLILATTTALRMFTDRVDIAASQCAQEVLYLREILREFHETQQSQTLVYEDNLACISM